MSKDKIHTFAGKDIDVLWDKRLCIHVAECGQADNELFDGDRKPWCDPDTTSNYDVAEVCERCPSGALTYRDKSGKLHETAPAGNTVSVIYDGPLYLRGDLAIDGVPDDMPGVAFRAALCRCGQSKNKPFCDNSHRDSGFHDAGAVGEKGPASDASGGRIAVQPVKDGPLVVTGNLTLVAGSGRDAWHGEKVALCRCGQSKNKPFCDGTHSKAGFKSDWMRADDGAQGDQSTWASADADSATPQATRKLSTIAHIGVSEFTAYFWTKRIHPAGSLGFGSDILFDGEVRRPIACQDLPPYHWFRLWRRVSRSAAPMHWSDSIPGERRRDDKIGIISSG